MKVLHLVVKQWGVGVAVTKNPFLFIFFILVAWLGRQKLFAAALQKGQSKARLLLNLYQQDGDEGKQIYDGSGDESVDVIEPMLFVQHQITAKTNLNGQFVFDSWTAASDTKLDGQTGASGGAIERQGRGSGQIGFTTQEKSHAYSARGGISLEYDYRSINAGWGFEKSMAEDNFLLAINGQIFEDKTKTFDFSKQQTTDWQSKRVYSIDVSASQLLTANDNLNFSYTYILQKGTLENISSTIDVAGVRSAEVLPDKRNRHTLGSKWIHALSDTLASHLSYFYYQDDWDIQAHTFQLSAFQSLFDDDAYIEFSGRYYQQKRTKYYGDSFDSDKTFMTSDSDFDQFQAYRYGVHFSQIFSDQTKGIFKDFGQWDWSAGYYYYTRTNGLNSHTIQAAVGIEI